MPKRIDFPFQRFKSEYLSNFVVQSKSLDFDGDNSLEESATGNTTMGFTSTFSVAIWAKYTAPSSTGDDYLFGVVGDPTAAVNAILINTEGGTDNERMLITVNNSSGTTVQRHRYASVAARNVWRHLVFTWDGVQSNLKFYLNGVETAAEISPVNGSGATITDTDRRVVLGGALQGVNSGWIGPVFDTALFTSVLSQDEVTAIYNGGNGAGFNLQENSGNYVSADNLIHYYRLGIGSSDTDFGLDRGTAANHNAVNSNIDDSFLVSDVPS